MTPARRSTYLVRLVCILAPLLWMALAGSSLLQRLEVEARDVALRRSPPGHPASPIVLVTLDDRAVRRYGPVPWPPALMAQTLTSLCRLQPRVVGVDFIYTGQGSRQLEAEENKGLDQLKTSLEHCGNAVIGMYFEFQADPDTPLASAPPELDARRIRQIRYLPGVSGGLNQVPVPLAAGVQLNATRLSGAAHSFGHLNLLPGEDGTIRWMPLLIRYRDALYPSFDLELARAYLGGDAPQALIGQQRVESLTFGNGPVTTDESGRLLVRFAGGAGTYPAVSAADLLAGRVSAATLRGRLVLLGVTATASGDVWTTPMARFMPGVEVHANAIGNLLQHDFLVANWRTRLASQGLLALLALIGFFILPRSRTWGIEITALFGAAFLIVVEVGLGWIVIHTGKSLALVSPLGTMATLLAGTLIVNYFSEERYRKQVERSFAQYLDQKVIGELLATPERLCLGGERRELTALFCDIRSFTSLAEGISPEETVRMLTEFFNRMTEVIFAAEGVLDKFVGDQVMAFWGAPVQQPDHARRACTAALAMRREFLALRDVWAETRLADAKGWRINCGLGLNTGPMVVGNIGSAKRFSYTVIGDAVNIAARLEALNKTYGTQILVGPDTWEAARDAFHFREVDRVQIRGRSQELSVYELLGAHTDAAPDAAWLEAFGAGREAFRRQDWGAAETAFNIARARRPDDACAAYYLEKLAKQAGAATVDR